MFDHLDTLDSRALRNTDCYGQRFMRSGKYHYHVLPVGGQHIDRDRPYVVQVNDRKSGGTMTQHTLQPRWNGREFAQDKAEVAVEVGDLVIWNCPDQAAPPHEVVGDKDFFGSAKLVNECGFSHAFGLPGVYLWGDAYGSDVGGVIRVKDPKCKMPADLAQWQSGLSKAALVMVADGKAEPAEVEITIGQTVYFAIVAGKGITVTDRRLHGIGACGERANPTPKGSGKGAAP